MRYAQSKPTLLEVKCVPIESNLHRAFRIVDNNDIESALMEYQFRMHCEELFGEASKLLSLSCVNTLLA